MNNKPRLIDWLDRLAAAQVVCVGDVMLDRFVYGEVERISPEAPIPVLRIAREAVTVGGAGNVARNLSALGTETRLFGVVGDDPAGREAAEVLSFENAVALSLTADGGRPTTVKTRFIAGGQQLLRTDEEDLTALSDQLLAQLSADVAASVSGGKCGALILSDYGKGVLTDAMIAAAMDAARAAGVPVVSTPRAWILAAIVAPASSRRTGASWVRPRGCRSTVIPKSRRRRAT